MTDENPYLTMPQDVLATHLKQLKVAVDTKKVDVTQFFGEPVTSEQVEKLAKFDSLTAQVEELSSAASAKDLSEVDAKLAETMINRTVSDLRKLDPDVPLESVLNSKFNNLDKLSILGIAENFADHYVKQISTIKKELGSKSGQVEQQFSAPENTDDLSKIYSDVAKACGVEA